MFIGLLVCIIFIFILSRRRTAIPDYGDDITTDRDYDQTAVVSANFGNALPVVGAVLGGPTVAAVVLIFSQIFKEPLSEVGQVYYEINGSWDEPLVESVTAEAFAEQGLEMGCVDEAE